MPPHASLVRRTFSLAFLAGQLAGCVSWHTQHGASDLLARKSPDRVRVTVADTHLVVWQPRIAKDSLYGTLAPHVRASAQERPVGLSLREVQRIETRGFNSGRTIVLGLGSLAMATGVALFVALGAAISGSD